MFVKRLAILSLFSSLAVFSHAAPVTAPTSLIEDQYIYAHAPINGHTRTIGSLFTISETEWGGRIRVKFKSDLPIGVTAGSNYTVTSAKIEAWVDEASQATVINWNPDDVKIGVYAAGYEAAGTGEADWFATKDRFDNWSSEFSFTSPYGRDFVTDAVLTGVGTPWAVGTHPDYPYATAPTDKVPFKVTFDLDVADPKIQSELKSDLESGYSSWFFSTNFIGQVNGTYPKLALKGLAFGETGEYTEILPNAPAQIPSLTITVEAEAPSAVSDWVIYN